MVISFFERVGALNNLPSFPTRRSSDLFFLTGEPALADRYFPWLVNFLSPAYWVYLVMAVTVLFNAMKRSEEHTSELQSRENLVCRLLLDKKKRRLGQPVYRGMIAGRDV